MQYRLKCEKVVTRDDVTNVVTSSALPAMLDEQNQVAPDGLLVSVSFARRHVNLCLDNEIRLRAH